MVYLSMSLRCCSALCRVACKQLQQINSGRRKTVVHWNVPQISRLPRCVIADIVLASSPSELEDSKRDLFLPPSLLDRENVVPRRIPTHLLTCICARRVRLMADCIAGSIARQGAVVPRFSENTVLLPGVLANVFTYIGQ